MVLILRVWSGEKDEGGEGNSRPQNQNSELPLTKWVISRKKNGLEFKRIKLMFYHPQLKINNITLEYNH
jgi:hypothetical protein